LTLLAGLLALALAIGIGAVVLADGIRDRNRNDVFTVTGSAKHRITSDYVIWQSSISSQRRTPQAAAAELAGWAKTYAAFLRGAGAGAGELSIQPLSTETLTDSNNGGNVVGYKLTRTFTIR